MTHGEGAYDPPEWYLPFSSLQILADELRCSVMEAAAADPEWRHMARTKLVAHAQAEKRKAGVPAN